MTELKGLADKDVNTSDVIGVYKHSFTKFVEKEPNDLEKAIKKIEQFLATRTPKYKHGQEPKYDNNGKLIDPGIEETVLYQFDPDNKIEFSESLREIDRAMKVIPLVAMDIRKQLKNLKSDGTPMNIPFGMPEQEKQKTWKEKLSFGAIKKEEFSEEDEYVRDLIAYIYEVRDRWGYWKEWYFGSIKYPENRGTWSDIYSRRGMENLLTRLIEFFDYWIVTRFLPIHQYAMDIQLSTLKDDANEFVKALARMQHDKEMQQPGF